jgi:hypothetical protein
MFLCKMARFSTKNISNKKKASDPAQTWARSEVFILCRDISLHKCKEGDNMEDNKINEQHDERE